MKNYLGKNVLFVLSYMKNVLRLKINFHIYIFKILNYIYRFQASFIYFKKKG